MKKIFLLYPVVVLMALVAILYTSCKKPHHDLAPTPNNVRLMSYTATTWVNSTALADTVNENYTFSYDGSGRVSGIIYTTNDTAFYRYTGGYYSEKITFDYNSTPGYVVKTLGTLGGAIPTVFERDSFILSSQGLITATFEPEHISTYEYYGKLMARESDSFYNYYHGVTSVTDSRIYNSDNGNFLNYSSNCLLSVYFPNTMSISPYPMRDYWVQSTGLAYGPNSLYYVNAPWTPVPPLNFTVHPNLGSYNDQLTFTTSGIPLIIFAKDTANDTCFVDFPGTIWPNEAYTFYSDLASRTGDYLQLLSFTKWGGYNLYQNTNLVKSIINSGYTTNVTYNIDAYNKITQMTAKVIDSLANTRTTTYNLQYETY